MGKEGKAMLGMADGWVSAALILCLASTVFCTIYGLWRWNEGDEPVEDVDRKWVDDEKKIEKNL